MKYVLGLDIGTSHCKAILLTLDGQVLASKAAGYPLATVQPGWAEQDPQPIWRAVEQAVRQALEQSGGSQAIAGLSLSGAMHSLFPVDASGQPLTPAMIWADQRAAPQAAELRAQIDTHTLYQQTGCPVQPIYHPARLRWLAAMRPELVSQAVCLVGIKDWIFHQLTGQWATDLGLASTTGLLNIHTGQWDPVALQAAGISAGQLPRLVSPLEQFGLSAFAAGRFGLPEGLPVIIGTSDGGLANVGAGAGTPGTTAITIGTSGAVRRMVAQVYLDRQERTWCYLLLPERWFAGGAINNAGLAVQWVREHFYPDVSGDAGYLRLFADAAQVPPGAEGLTWLPYFTGERSPHWNPTARGSLHGLGLQHTRAHIARAVLEGVAFCLADVWNALGMAPGTRACLTGTVTKTPVWSQILADVLNAPLDPVEAADASGIGAALLGWYALGHTAALDGWQSPHEPDQWVHPDRQRAEVYAGLHATFQDLYRRLYGENQATGSERSMSM